MPGLSSIYTTANIQRTVADIRVRTRFFLDNFFRQEQTDEREEIFFDIEDRPRRITPFVHPTKEGRIVEDQGFSTGMFRPAYVKDKRTIKPGQVLRRQYGEAIGGVMSNEARESMLLLQALKDQQDMYELRQEVMCAEALRTGTVTVGGEDYPTVVVNFGRAAGLTVTLTGTDLWTDAASDPLGDLTTWRRLGQSSGGGRYSDCILGATAWAAARDNADFRAMLDNRRFETGSRVAQMLASDADADFMGSIDGSLNLWTYGGQYHNGTTDVLLHPDDEVTMVGQMLEGTRCYGAIHDPSVGYAAVPSFTKSWLIEDPGARVLLMQGAPLMVPYRPNASFNATVV